MIHSIIPAELKGNRTSCQFLKFFVTARKFPRLRWSVSPVDWALIWPQELLIHPVNICMEGVWEKSVLIQFDPFTNYFWPLGVYAPMSHKWGVRGLSSLAQPPLTFLALQTGCHHLLGVFSYVTSSLRLVTGNYRYSLDIHQTLETRSFLAVKHLSEPGKSPFAFLWWPPWLTYRQTHVTKGNVSDYFCANSAHKQLP